MTTVDPTSLTPVRLDKPQTWQLEESLSALMECPESPVLAYRVPKTPLGWWTVQLRSRVHPLSLPPRELQALVTGLWEGIYSCTPATTAKRTRQRIDELARGEENQ